MEMTTTRPAPFVFGAIGAYPSVELVRARTWARDTGMNWREIAPEQLLELHLAKMILQRAEEARVAAEAKAVAEAAEAEARRQAAEAEHVEAQRLAELARIAAAQAEAAKPKPTLTRAVIIAPAASSVEVLTCGCGTKMLPEAAFLPCNEEMRKLNGGQRVTQLDLPKFARCRRCMNRRNGDQPFLLTRQRVEDAARDAVERRRQRGDQDVSDLRALLRRR